MRIRVSPSGPFFTADTGAIPDFGQGMPTRRAVGLSPTDSAELTNVPIVVPVGIVQLPNPQAGLRYSAELNFDLQNTGAGSGVVDVILEASPDGGENYYEMARAQSLPVSQNTAGELTMQHVTLISTDLTGTALHVVNGTSTALLCRATIAAPSGAGIFVKGGGGTGTDSLVLTERL